MCVITGRADSAQRIAAGIASGLIERIRMRIGR